MQIAIVTQYYPPDVPGRIPNEVAVEMRDRGHEVRVLTTFPHYATGKVADGFRQRFRYLEERDEISVRRVPIIPSHSRSSAGRVANYLSFACSARVAGDFVRGADVVYVHGTPATAVEPARAWKKSGGIPFVYHVQDIWPESVTESGFLPRPINNCATSVINRWLDRVYTSAAAVIAIAPTARQLLIERRVPEDRCKLVFNWADETGETGNIGDEQTEKEIEGFTLVYAGNLGGFQDLETVIRAAKRCDDLEGFRLRIAGSGVAGERLRLLVDELGAKEQIEFLGRLDRKQMAALYAIADFQIVSLKDFDFFAGTIPSKFQAGLFHGLPLITTVKGDVTRLVEEYELGFTAMPENVDSLATAFRRAYETSTEERQRLRLRTRAYYASRLSKKHAMDQIEAILADAAESGRLGKRR